MRGETVKIAAIIFVLLAGGVISDHHYQHQNLWNNSKDNQKRSTIIFKLTGNVYPQGYYYAEVSVGQPPKPYFLDPDTGSDITWIQCNAPCKSCIKGYHPWYPPTKDFVPDNHAMCKSLHSGGRDENVEQCHYHLEYADGLSTLGVLLWDQFSFKITGGASLSPRLVLGCGYDQLFQGHGSSVHKMDGMLGLGRGKASIVSQLYSQGVISNVVGHCLSGSKKGGGFVFLGDQVYDPKKLSWTPLSKDNTHYVTGPAELTFDGKSVGLKGLVVLFDSGMTYTYLNDKIYAVILSLIKNNLKGTPLKEAPDDITLAVCWKGEKPFKNVSEVKPYFKNLVLIFPNGKIISPFEISPERYLIISSKGNACLGILNGKEAGLEHNMVGDISMQDKMVVYDNEKRAIGWMVANCDETPKNDQVYHMM